jgi:hypothetical protein
MSAGQAIVAAKDQAGGGCPQSCLAPCRELGLTAAPAGPLYQLPQAAAAAARAPGPFAVILLMAAERWPHRRLASGGCRTVRLAAHALLP